MIFFTKNILARINKRLDILEYNLRNLISQVNEQGNTLHEHIRSRVSRNAAEDQMLERVAALESLVLNLSKRIESQLRPVIKKAKKNKYGKK